MELDGVAGTDAVGAGAALLDDGDAGGVGLEVGVLEVLGLAEVLEGAADEEEVLGLVAVELGPLDDFAGAGPEPLAYLLPLHSALKSFSSPSECSTSFPGFGNSTICC